MTPHARHPDRPRLADGAAGSAVVFLVWAYWSSLGFLFGARLAWALEELWTRHRDAASIAADTRLGGLPGASEPPPPAM